MEVTGEGTCRGATEEQREGRCHQKGELQQRQVSSRPEMTCRPPVGGQSVVSRERDLRKEGHWVGVSRVVLVTRYERAFF